MNNATPLQLWELAGCSRLKLAQKANDLGVPVLKAIELRTRRIKQQLQTWSDLFAESDDPVTIEMAYREMAYLVKELDNLMTRPVEQSGITEAMIDRAREVPITEMLEFKMNKAVCVFHDDKQPSLHYYPKNNSTYCFSCGKYGDAIDVYMALKGCSFPVAVKEMTR